ncbi:hypothetical protein [Sphingopyxis flava]|uniref:Uncharacterized protein n=1 Tax=Sphingopyxis flava TaxID=1507287 RepID=A0A1T5ABG7_9SPHN|nr:hypothetical protein [Sphingopyxis flava]SKB32245.1 hypothetical protein SAMN06295937_100357 [Sphingopyxis flava]
MNRTAAWLFAAFALLAFAGWLFRYDVEPMSKAQVVRLDRITGAVRLCDAQECVEPRLMKGLSDERRKEMIGRLSAGAAAAGEENPLIEAYDRAEAERSIKP